LAQTHSITFSIQERQTKIKTLYTAAVACLAYGLNQHNEVIRCAVAHAGNDYRLGAQEAPPAIISLSPGVGFEAHIDSIIRGGPLLGYKTEKGNADPRTAAAMPATRGVEDRNRTAPFPFCGNRFEFRAVGSSQNCAFPIMACNTIMASGMAALSDLLETGLPLRDAVANLYSNNKRVIFVGDGYSEEWRVEAENRGLQNLKTTPEAVVKFNSPKVKTLFKEMGIFDDNEVEARAEVMIENYITTLSTEVETLLNMMETGIIPACTKDLVKYSGSMKQLAGNRESIYTGILRETQKLREMCKQKSDEALSEAKYLCEVVKPQMSVIRSLVDEAEGLIETDLYPFPTYEQLLFSHHA
jgi:glutamine synthetase